jgi:hypothetical protein
MIRDRRERTNQVEIEDMGLFWVMIQTVVWLKRFFEKLWII